MRTHFELKAAIAQGMESQWLIIFKAISSKIVYRDLNSIATICSQGSYNTFQRPIYLIIKECAEANLQSKSKLLQILSIGQLINHRQALNCKTCSKNTPRKKLFIFKLNNIFHFFDFEFSHI